jgi:hypothetical protein
MTHWLKDMPVGTRWASQSKFGGISYVYCGWDEDSDAPIMQQWINGKPKNQGMTWVDWRGDCDTRAPHPEVIITWQIVKVPE